MTTFGCATTPNNQKHDTYFMIEFICVRSTVLLTKEFVV